MAWQLTTKQYFCISERDKAFHHQTTEGRQEDLHRRQLWGQELCRVLWLLPKLRSKEPHLDK